MIADFLRQTAQLLAELDQAAIARARDILLEAYRRQGRVFTVGNGGSASTAQHFACDLAKFVIPPGAATVRRPLPDRQRLALHGLGQRRRPGRRVRQPDAGTAASPSDVVILISVHGGKGFSGDLVHALRYANEVGAQHDLAGRLRRRHAAPESTCSILVPVDSTPQTEAIHLVIEHLLMARARRRVGPGRGR